MPLNDSLLSIIDPGFEPIEDESPEEAEERKKKKEAEEREKEVQRLIKESQRSLPHRVVANAVAGVKGAGQSGAATIKMGAAVAVANSGVANKLMPDPDVRDAFVQSLKDQAGEDLDQRGDIDKRAALVDEIAGGGNKLAGTAVRGAFSSLAQMGVMLPTGPVGVIGSFAATASTDGYHQAIDAGLSEDEAVKFGIWQGAIEGGVTAAFQSAGKFIPGLAGLEGLAAGKAAVRKGIAAGARGAGIRVASELTEEHIIGIAGAVNSVVSDVDPEATSFDNILDLITETTATTLLTMGLAEGGQRGVVKGFNVLADAEAKHRGEQPVEITPEEEAGFQRDFAVDALSELDPENATRKQVAEALGLKPANLPDEFKSKEARRGAILQAQQEKADRTASQDAALAEVQQDEDTIEAAGPDSETVSAPEPEDAGADEGRDIGPEGAETAQGVPGGVEKGPEAIAEPSEEEIVAPEPSQELEAAKAALEEAEARVDSGDRSDEALEAEDTAREQVEALEQGRKEAEGVVETTESLIEPEESQVVEQEVAARATGSGKIDEFKPTKEIELDPERFQFKKQDEKHKGRRRKGEGATGSLAEIKEKSQFDVDPGGKFGVIQVWLDPADGKTYVVNGHNRLAKAKELGFDNVPVVYITAENAADAKMQGAINNLAEGKGTAIDAADFFRSNPEFDDATLREEGIQMGKSQMKTGMALANLGDRGFNAVMDAEITENEGQIIGENLTDTAKQNELIAEIIEAKEKDNEMTNFEIREMAQEMAHGGPDVQGDLLALPGMTVEESGRSLMRERGQVKEMIDKELREDSIFDKVAKKKGRLGKGGTKVDKEQAEKIALQAKKDREIFQRTKNNVGPLGDIINAFSRRLRTGESKADIKEELLNEARKALRGETTTLEGTSAPDVTQREGDSDVDSPRADDTRQEQEEDFSEPDPDNDDDLESPILDGFLESDIPQWQKDIARKANQEFEFSKEFEEGEFLGDFIQQKIDEAIESRKGKKVKPKAKTKAKAKPVKEKTDLAHAKDALEERRKQFAKESKEKGIGVIHDNDEAAQIPLKINVNREQLLSDLRKSDRLPDTVLPARGKLRVENDLKKKTNDLIRELISLIDDARIAQRREHAPVRDHTIRMIPMNMAEHRKAITKAFKDKKMSDKDFEDAKQRIAGFRHSLHLDRQGLTSEQFERADQLREIIETKQKARNDLQLEVIRHERKEDRERVNELDKELVEARAELEIINNPDITEEAVVEEETPTKGEKRGTTDEVKELQKRKKELIAQRKKDRDERDSRPGGNTPKAQQQRIESATEEITAIGDRIIELTTTGKKRTSKEIIAENEAEQAGKNDFEKVDDFLQQNHLIPEDIGLEDTEVELAGRLLKNKKFVHLIESVPANASTAAKAAMFSEARDRGSVIVKEERAAMGKKPSKGQPRDKATIHKVEDKGGETTPTKKAKNDFDKLDALLDAKQIPPADIDILDGDVGTAKTLLNNSEFRGLLDDMPSELAETAEEGRKVNKILDRMSELAREAKAGTLTEEKAAPKSKGKKETPEAKRLREAEERATEDFEASTTDEYRAAFKKHGEASKQFMEDSKAFREGRMDETQFIQKQNQFAKDTQEFDIAFAKEQERVEAREDELFSASEADPKRSLDDQPDLFGPETGAFNLDLIPVPKKGKPADPIKDRSPENEEVARRMDAAAIAPNEANVAQTDKTLLDYAAMITRAAEHLPNSPRFAVAREVFRLYKDQSERAARETDKQLNHILEPLKGNPDAYDLFKRLVVMRDLAESVKLDEPLRYGFTTQEEVEAELAKLEAELDSKDYKKTVKRALDRRRGLQKRVQDTLVAEGLLSEDVDRGSYFRHQIRHYLMAKAVGEANTGTALNKETPDFARARVKGAALGEKFDPNSDYLGPEREFLMRTNEAIQARRAMNLLDTQYNIMRPIRRLVKKHNRALSELNKLIEDEEGKTTDEQLDKARTKLSGLRSDIRSEWGVNVRGRANADDIAAAQEGMTQWQPKPGSVWYPAMTITEAQIDQINDAMMDMQMPELTTDDFKTVMALGGKLETWVIPEQLANQLDSMKRPEQDRHIASFLQTTQAAWKRWILHNPLTVFTYNLRNMAGDLDVMLAGNPGALKQVPKAIKEIIDWKVNGKETQELKEALQYSVIDAGEVHADIMRTAKKKDFSEFAVKDQTRDEQIAALQAEKKRLRGKRFTEDKIAEIDKKIAFAKLRRVRDPFQRLFWDAPGKVMQKVFVNPTAARESVFRHAAYLDYKKKLAAGKPFHYGASKEAEVRSIRSSMGDNAAAAHMARNLTGDYGNVTVAGDLLRKYIVPFWAFSELNIRRYKQININNAKFRPSDSVAINAAIMATAYARNFTLIGILSMLNHLLHPEEEELLPEFDKNTPHLILGGNGEDIYIMRNMSAFGEMIEWVGANDAISQLISNVDGPENEKTAPSDVVLGMMANFANKAAGSLTPLAKGSIEVATGQSFFPDIFNPRDVPQDELAAGQIGLSEPYKWLAGMFDDKGMSARPGLLARPFTGVVNVNSANLHEVYDKIQKFEDSKGVESPDRGSGGISAHRNMKKAIQNNNREAFNETFNNFVKARDFLTYTDIMNRMNPLHGKLNKAEKKEFLNDFLTPEQRTRTNEAVRYAQTMKGRGITWFKEEMAKQPADVQAQFKLDEAKHTLRVFDPFTAIMRDKKKDKLEQIKDEQNAAMQEMALLGLTLEDVKDALRTHNAASPRSQDRSVDAIRRGIRRFGSIKKN